MDKTKVRVESSVHWRKIQSWPGRALSHFHEHCCSTQFRGTSGPSVAPGCSVHSDSEVSFLTDDEIKLLYDYIKPGVKDLHQVLVHFCKLLVFTQFSQYQRIFSPILHPTPIRNDFLIKVLSGVILGNPLRGSNLLLQLCLAILGKHHHFFRKRYLLPFVEKISSLCSWCYFLLWLNHQNAAVQLALCS